MQSLSDDEQKAIFEEVMLDELKAITELVKDVPQLVRDVSVLKDDVAELKTDMKTVKVAIKDLSHQVRRHEKDIELLKAAR